MDNLFSLDPTFHRVQYKKLSDNIREWQEEIGALVAAKLPKDLGLSPTVAFQKVEEDRGYAIGTAVVTDPSSGKKIGVPIIVKSWHLAPLDLFFDAEGKLHTLSDDELAKVFYQNSLGTGVASKKPPPSMADDAFADVRNPPLGGKYSYSSPIGSMLERISGTLGAQDILALKKTASDPQLIAAYHRRGNLGILKKYAEETPAEAEEDKARAASVFTIKKDGPNEYRLYSATDEVFDPVMVSTDRQGLKNWLDMRQAELWSGDDPLSCCDRFGHYTLEPPKSPYGAEVADGFEGDALGERKNTWVFDPLQDDQIVTTIAKFGRYAVRDKDGVVSRGWVVPNVISFDGTPVSTKLFLSKALGAIQSRISGIPAAVSGL